MFPFWTRPQRRALLLFTGIFWVALAARLACDPVYLPEGPDAPSPRSADLQDRIDPNTADWQTLAAIPTLGEKRARAIVAYREKAIAAGHGPIVFHNAPDLRHIKGIGPSTASNLEPYLFFPATTQPVGVTK